MAGDRFLEKNNNDDESLRERFLDTLPLSDAELDILLSYEKVAYDECDDDDDESCDGMAKTCFSRLTLLAENYKHGIPSDHGDRLRVVERTLFGASAGMFLSHALESVFLLNSDSPSWKFLEAAVTLLGRRGPRSILGLIYELAGWEQAQQESASCASAEIRRPSAEALVQLCHNLILASEFLDQNSRPPPNDMDDSASTSSSSSWSMATSTSASSSSLMGHSPPAAWVRSLIAAEQAAAAKNQAFKKASSNGIKHQHYNDNCISRTTWIEWATWTAPQIHSALSTFCHLALFSTHHAFRPTSPRWHLLDEHPSRQMCRDQCMLTQQQRCSLSIMFHRKWHWTRLYCNMEDGNSFPILQNAILGYKGPTLLLIQSKTKEVFGYFTTCPWKESKQWFGDESDTSADRFIFALEPTLSLYGVDHEDYNQRKKQFHMYLQSSPNNRHMLQGLAVGGISAGTPRIHLAKNLETCQASAVDTTYQSGPLLKDDKVVCEVDGIQAWGLYETPQDLEKFKQGGLSQLKVKSSALARVASVDRAQFMEDFQNSGGTLFAHREQARGRHSFAAAEEDTKGYFLQDKPPSEQFNGINLSKSHSL